MGKKVTKTEAKKVMKALAEFYGASIMRQGENSPFIPEQEYKWNHQSTNGQEIVWESGDYDWPMRFSDWMENHKSEFGLSGILLEPYNGFVLGIYRW